VICALSGLAVGAAWLESTTPTYVATTNLLLDPITEKLASGDIASLNYLHSLTMDNQIAIVKSSRLLRRVVENQHLLEDSEFGDHPATQSPPPVGLAAYVFGITAASQTYAQRIAQLLTAGLSEATRIAGAIPPSNSERSEPVTRPEQSAAGADASLAPREILTAVGALGSAVSAKRIGQSDVMSIAVTSRDPEHAARLANAVAAAYLDDPLYARLEAARRMTEWVDEKLPELRERARGSEEVVAKFRAEHKLLEGANPSSQDDNRSLNKDQMSQLNSRLAEARGDVAEKKAKVGLLEQLNANGQGLAALPDAFVTPMLNALRSELADASRKEAGLASRNSDRYPDMARLRAEQANVRSEIAAEERDVAGKIRNEYSLALARQQSIEQVLHDSTDRTSLDNNDAIRLRELQRVASFDRNLLEAFLKRAGVLQEESISETRVGRVIATAVRPDAPTYPNRPLVLSIALAAGMALGVGLACAREMFNSAFTTSRQAEEFLSMPLLGSITRMKVRDASIDAISHLARLAPPPKVSRAAQTLRSRISMMNVEKPPKVIQVTSAVQREGKSTASLLLAASSASAGAKTLLVDANARNPTLTRYFGLQGHLGLTNVLLDVGKLDEAVTFHDVHGLWVMPAGDTREDVGDVVTPARVRAVIERCRANFDCIVVDTPALAEATEPRVIAGFADKIVLVVKWGATAREVVAHNLRFIQRQDKVAGVAFNFVDQRLARKYDDRRLG
jgi:succinoglycan biosynthesis transport protein ExoP